MASSNLIDLDNFEEEEEEEEKEEEEEEEATNESSFLPPSSASVDNRYHARIRSTAAAASAVVGDQHNSSNIPIYNARGEAAAASQQQQVKFTYPGFKDQTREASTIPVASAVAVEDSVQESESEQQLRRQLEEQNQRLAEQNRRLEEAEQQLATVNHPQHNVNRPPTLPAALSESSTNEERTGSNRFVIVGIVFAIAALAVGVLCGSGNCASSSSSPSPSGPKAIVLSPTDARFTTPRSEAIVAYINSITLSGRTLSYPNFGLLAEERALNWLIDEDLGTAETNKLNVRQRFALVTLWFQNGPFDSAHTRTWLSSMDECEWESILTCVSGEVTWMDLGIDRLSGQLPSNLGLLTAMQSLYLNANQLRGSIPSELGMLTVMRRLSLTLNQLTGSIPSELGMLLAMTSLSLSTNRLTGTIPTELARLTALRQLDVFNNNLSGDMPFCNADTRPSQFTDLIADCHTVTCECCTECCPLGGFNGNPQVNSICEAA